MNCAICEALGILIAAPEPEGECENCGHLVCAEHGLPIDPVTGKNSFLTFVATARKSWGAQPLRVIRERGTGRFGVELRAEHTRTGTIHWYRRDLSEPAQRRIADLLGCPWEERSPSKY